MKGIIIKKAFTIVELIVVMSILWVLSGLWMISYFWYTENTRDAVRVANVNSITKALEVKKSLNGNFPAPDNSTSIEFMGQEIWKQWVLWQKTKESIDFLWTQWDPKYETDYSYSVSSDGERFEVGTILENQDEAKTSYFFSSAYANQSDRTYSAGNIDGKFYSTKRNGETYIFSIPSMTLKDFSGWEIIIDQPTTQFSIPGEGAIPHSYVGKSWADNNVEFTPKLLYKWKKCWVETDQEIVNFVATLRDSFNSEPYISNPYFAGIFSDYETLRNNIDDFAALEKLGLKINALLGCNITNFKTVDIFPTQCGYEGLNFEWVSDGFSVRNNSCLFQYEGNGDAIVRDSSGTWGSKGLNINPGWGTWKFSYRVFTYKPAKFEFDISSTQLQGSSYVEFYINGNRFIRKQSWDDYSAGYEKYSTSLLPPGLYDFEWKIFKNNSYNTQVWLDNLDFTCVWGGAWCGWTYGFETGDQDPNEMFTFDGEVKIPWQVVNDATQGTQAIVNPLIPTSKDTSITYTKTLDVPARLSFDYKIDDHHDGWVRLYINDIEYKQWWWGTRGDPLQVNYGTYLTPLLPAGTHDIKITVYRNWNTGHKTFVYLDNFQTACELWDTWCGMNLSFENTDESYLWYFSFDGSVNTPWWLESESENVSEGSYSMRSPNLPVSTTASMYYHKDFTEPAKISFDYKLEQAGSWAKFYIDGVEYDHIWYGWRNPWEWFHTFTTPILRWEHEIEIKVFRNWNSGMWWHFVYLYVDNFRISCFWGVWVPGNENCWWTDWTFENGSSYPDDLYDFTWGINLPWVQVDGTWSWLWIKSPKSDTSTHSYMWFTKTLTSGQELVFDYKFSAWCGGSAWLLINSSKQNFGSASNYTEYRTWPLSAGTYNFQFNVFRNWNTCSFADLYLDNLRIE